MRKKVVALAVVALVYTASVPVVYAQRGMGDQTGVARQAVTPKLISLSGDIVAVLTQPCEKTAGVGRVGTHILLRTEDGKELNVHLGWAIAVEEIAKQLTLGEQVTVTAFRTEKMPVGHYVAKSLTSDGKTVQLRDDNLRPTWAGVGRGYRAWQGGYGRGWRGGRGAWRR